MSRRVYATPGVDDLGSIYPHVAQEWHPSKNGDATPADVSKYSGRKFWWLGNTCGHSWEARVANRTKNSAGCPVCTGKLVVPGVNDLATTNPELLKDWDYERNSLEPNEISAGSTKKVWWRCGKLHLWETRPGVRTGPSRSGCPVCSGVKVISGSNDLLTVNPELASQWSELNGSALPSHYTAQSGYRAWWQCATHEHHTWQARIVDRNRNGTREPTNCPKCAGRESKRERALRDFLQGISGDHEILSNVRNVIRNPNTRRGLELDIYIPDLRLAFEFDGTHWHSDEMVMRNKGMTALEFRNLKVALCNEEKIFLLFVAEEEWVNGNQSLCRDLELIMRDAVSGRLIENWS